MHFDRLRNLSDFHHRIDDQISIHLKCDARPRERAELRQGCLQPVWPDGQVGKREESVFIRDCAAAESGVGLRHRHFHAGQNGSGRVVDSAADLSGSSLSKGIRQDENSNHHSH